MTDKVYGIRMRHRKPGFKAGYLCRVFCFCVPYLAVKEAGFHGRIIDIALICLQKNRKNVDLYIRIVYNIGIGERNFYDSDDVRKIVRFVKCFRLCMPGRVCRIIWYYISQCEWT